MIVRQFLQWLRTASPGDRADATSALARAYLRTAQVLILDEPTAALDARAEYEVFLRFSELVRGRMAILISHRFSTVRLADRILVLEQGRVTESGCHAELLAGGGLYSRLHAAQAGTGSAAVSPAGAR